MNHISNLIAFFGAHKVLSGALAFALMAFVSSMPKPGSSFSWLTVYIWLYDWLHALLPKSNPTQIVTVTAPAPKEKVPETENEKHI